MDARGVIGPQDDGAALAQVGGVGVDASAGVHPQLLGIGLLAGEGAAALALQFATGQHGAAAGCSAHVNQQALAQAHLAPDEAHAASRACGATGQGVARVWARQGGFRCGSGGGLK